jgi:hypothetical protein
MFDKKGGNVDVHVTTSQGCSWAATTTAGWITITSGASGSGNGTTRVTVDSAAPSQLPRTDTVTIAGITFTVQQR